MPIHSPQLFHGILLPLLLIVSLSPLPIRASEHQFTVDGRVLELDESNFDAAISSFDYIFVDFYAPWCGHCKRLSPELDKAAPVLAGLKQPIVVAKVNADKYGSLRTKHEIDGYPTLKIFMHGVPTEYYGPRKADLLVRFLTKFVAPDVAVLNSDSAINEFVQSAGSHFPIFIGFGLNESVISSLAIKYKKKAWFSVAKDFSGDVMTFYDFDKVPALVAIHPEHKEQNIFYGPFEESFLEDYIKQNLLPLVLPISEDSLKLLKDDDRKIALAFLEDDADEISRKLINVLRSAASANRDLIFGYVGIKQWEDFAESFEVYKKTPLPKMIVWDGNQEYYSVIGSESIQDSDMATQISRFLEGYREGSIVQKRVNGPSFAGFFKSQLGYMSFCVIILVVLVAVLFFMTFQEEPLTVGTRDQMDHTRSSQQETRELHRDSTKED